MRNLFPGYQRKSKEDLEQLWKNAIFCFDTNVLLDLYRYSEKTRAELVDIVGGYRDRVFIPHQVAFEFHRKRLNTIIDQKAPYLKIQSDFGEILRDIDSKSSHPHFSQNISGKAIELDNLIKKECAEAEEKIKSQLEKDVVFDGICDLFDGRVGEPLADDAKKIDAEAEARYKMKMPPGYKDGKKDDKGYGDYYVWLQMIEKANAAKLPMIFITGETKVDWWWYAGDVEDKHGDKLGPRPELINEFKEKAKQDFHIYSTASFMQFGKQDLRKEELDPGILKEVKDIQSEKAVNLFNQYKAYYGSDVHKMFNHGKLIDGYSNFSEIIKGYNSTMDRLSESLQASMSPENRELLNSLGRPMRDAVIQSLIRNSIEKKSNVEGGDDDAVEPAESN